MLNSFTYAIDLSSSGEEVHLARVDSGPLRRLDKPSEQSWQEKIAPMEYKEGHLDSMSLVTETTSNLAWKEPKVAF